MELRRGWCDIYMDSDGKTEETESGSYTATVTLSAGTTVAYSVKAAKIADSGTDPAS